MIKKDYSLGPHHFFLTCVPNRKNLYEMGSASELTVVARGMRHILHHLQQLFTLKRN